MNNNNIVKQEGDVIVIRKHAETSKNRVIVPASFIKNVGREFDMEVHSTYVVLKSTKDDSLYVRKEK